MLKNKICIVTAARSEYGLLRWLIDEINLDHELELQLVVTGSHLSDQFGNTVDEIEADGYKIIAKVDMNLMVDSKIGIANSMGICAIGISEVFAKIKPNIILFIITLK